MLMDPQQRLLLEAATESLTTHCGSLPATATGRIAVYIGIAPSDYSSVAKMAESGPYHATANAVSAQIILLRQPFMSNFRQMAWRRWYKYCIGDRRQETGDWILETRDALRHALSHRWSHLYSILDQNASCLPSQPQVISSCTYQGGAMCCTGPTMNGCNMMSFQVSLDFQVTGFTGRLHITAGAVHREFQRFPMFPGAVSSVHKDKMGPQPRCCCSQVLSSRGIAM